MKSNLFYYIRENTQACSGAGFFAKFQRFWLNNEFSGLRSGAEKREGVGNMT